MIKLKEGVNTKLIIEVTNEGTPYDGEVSFGIYNKKGEVIRQKEVDAEGGIAEITLPKIKENDYRFTLETDEGYSDIQDLIVSKSIREAKGELQRKYQIDINNQWDEKYEKNIGKNKILMNEFYMNNGKRIKKLESDIEEHKGKMDMDKGEVIEMIGKNKEETKKELEDFSKVIGSKIEGVSRELVSFEKSSEEKIESIVEDLDMFKTETNDAINETQQTINTITEVIGDISKNNEQNGLSILEKINTVEKKIPTGGILDYDIDDEGLSTKILWTSDKIDKRIRGEVGRQKKYVSYQNMFDTIAVAGQDNLQPTSPLDELTIVAGTGMTITTDASTNTLTLASGTGDVVGPASSTDNAIARYDGATGKLLQDSLATVSDVGEISTPSNVVAKAFYTSAHNGVAMEGSNAGQGKAFLYATGNDTNIDLELSGQGTGKVKVTDDFNVTGSASIDSLTASEIVITDASKNLVSASVSTYPSLTELTYLKGVTSAIQTQLNGKLGLSGGTVTGAVVLDENASLQLDGSLSADGKRSGTTITATAGYTQAFGDLVYLDPTDSRREAVDANAADGADGDARGLLGMVVSAGTDGNACTILLQGTIRADANFPTLTVGAPVYASETAGDVVVSAPTTSGVVVRIVGSALTADSMYFNPSGSFIVVV